MDTFFTQHYFWVQPPKGSCFNARWSKTLNERDAVKANPDLGGATENTIAIAHPNPNIPAIYRYVAEKNES